MTAALIQTLGDPQWMAANRQALKALLPETWTHIHNIDPLRIGYGLKLLGVDWRSIDEFGKVMAVLCAQGLIERRDGYLFRAKP